ncbi:class I SAM-dependent methyltransferase [Streptomyces rectiverticillatus]|uniref:class I SAM-dependent methyltransferase n=1 Tax=Streptomyces rectiverticillatus TaxID=173860 RepID=UPI0015C3276B|nr:class I SAM-dependent methyltransferase [Streptomyces rectiverticillatus]QLE75359.1 class I SAM-dependent methyltransferase [Streptomyces rectiverticillatus]
MTVQQYDDIGEAYEGFKSLPMARYPESDSFLRMLGDLSGKSVLDLACGTGFYSRQAKRLGAAEVLGVDVSDTMVAAAWSIEKRNPLGVRYLVGDGAELPLFDRRFDVATAVYLLNYADDAATMEWMCRGIHRSLRPGGEFFVLTQAPEFRFDGPPTEKYGFRYEQVGEGEVGPRVRITALLDSPVEFVTNYPRREVCEGALWAAGFRDVTWVPLEVPEDGISMYGAEFWEDFLANPPLVMLRCTAG